MHESLQVQCLMSSRSRDNVQPTTLRTCSDSCISVGPPLTIYRHTQYWIVDSEPMDSTNSEPMDSRLTQ